MGRYAAAVRSVKFKEASYGGQDVRISTDFGVNQAHRVSERVDRPKNADSRFGCY